MHGVTYSQNVMWQYQGRVVFVIELIELRMSVRELRTSVMKLRTSVIESSFFPPHYSHLRRHVPTPDSDVHQIWYGV